MTARSTFPDKVLRFRVGGLETGLTAPSKVARRKQAGLFGLRGKSTAQARSNRDTARRFIVNQPAPIRLGRNRPASNQDRAGIEGVSRDGLEVYPLIELRKKPLPIAQEDWDKVQAVLVNQASSRKV